MSDEIWVASLTFLGGLAAAFCCGLGVLPLFVGDWFRKRRVARRVLSLNVGDGHAFAGGLMLAAAFVALLYPAVTFGTRHYSFNELAIQLLVGIVGGALSVAILQRIMATSSDDSMLVRCFGSRKGGLLFLAMALHSAPEGLAVGTGFAAGWVDPTFATFGIWVSVAIALHNVPEGLVVAIPMKNSGASWKQCFCAAFLSSLPQPICAVPACLLVTSFDSLLVPAFSFAAGAMIYLVVVELIPEALQLTCRRRVAAMSICGAATLVLFEALRG